MSPNPYCYDECVSGSVPVATLPYDNTRLIYATSVFNMNVAEKTYSIWYDVISPRNRPAHLITAANPYNPTGFLKSFEIRYVLESDNLSTVLDYEFTVAHAFEDLVMTCSGNRPDDIVLRTREFEDIQVPAVTKLFNHVHYPDVHDFFTEIGMTKEDLESVINWTEVEFNRPPSYYDTYAG